MSGEKLLKPTEVAELLQVSITTIYGWTSARRIPVRKVGRLLRFDRGELESWMQRESVINQRTVTFPVRASAGSILG